MSSVNVPTKNVNCGIKIKDKFRRECDSKWSLEDGNEEYIKKETMTNEL